MIKENALHTKLLVLNYARKLDYPSDRLYTLAINAAVALHCAINTRGGLTYALHGNRFQRVLDSGAPDRVLDALTLDAVLLLDNGAAAS